MWLSEQQIKADLWKYEQENSCKTKLQTTEIRL